MNKPNINFIYEQVNKAEDWISAGITNHNKSTYEDGVMAALLWVSGENTDAPIFQEMKEK